MCETELDGVAVRSIPVMVDTMVEPLPKCGCTLHRSGGGRLVSQGAHSTGACSPQPSSRRTPAHAPCREQAVPGTAALRGAQGYSTMQGSPYTYHDVVREPAALYEMLTGQADRRTKYTDPVPQIWIDGSSRWF